MSNAASLSNAEAKPFIRSLQKGDVAELARTMRWEDAEEIRLSSDGTTLSALVTGTTGSPCSVIEWQGRVVAIFGISGLKGSYGIPWMLGTDDIKRIRKSLLRNCREVVQGYLKDYPYLTNACWSKNTVHIDWLKWLGFTFQGEDIRKGEVFLHFHQGKLCVNQPQC